MTIPGIDAIAGISILAAVGDFTRFDDPNKLVAGGKGAIAGVIMHTDQGSEGGFNRWSQHLDMEVSDGGDHRVG